MRGSSSESVCSSINGSVLFMMLTVDILDKAPPAYPAPALTSSSSMACNIIYT